MITENSTKEQLLEAVEKDEEFADFVGGIQKAEILTKEELYKRLCWFMELNAPLIF